MNKNYRLNKDKLLDALLEWDRGLTDDVLVIACGGTALTLQGYKESTKDVDCSDSESIQTACNFS